MKRYCLALDLKNDPQLIAEYEAHHQIFRPDISKSIKDAGVLSMEIYRIENRLFMIMDTEDDFDFERKAQMDDDNPEVQVWENLMWNYQQALPSAKPGEKWIVMSKIFDLK